MTTDADDVRKFKEVTEAFEIVRTLEYRANRLRFRVVIVRDILNEAPVTPFGARISVLRGDQWHELHEGGMGREDEQGATLEALAKVAAHREPG